MKLHWWVRCAAIEQGALFATLPVHIPDRILSAVSVKNDPDRYQ
jgi:hypothetical protein